jgi:hypothetical protein
MAREAAEICSLVAFAFDRRAKTGPEQGEDGLE